MNAVEIAVVMGSVEDMGVMKQAASMLDKFGVPFELEILDLHKNPDRAITYAKSAHTRDIKVIIAGASGAAHLPGVIASLSSLPVIGVPIKSENSIDGLDAIYSILQMPIGVPIATMALNGAENAAVFALQIMAVKHPSFQQLVTAYKNKHRQDAEFAADKAASNGWQDLA